MGPWCPLGGVTWKPGLPAVGMEAVFLGLRRPSLVIHHYPPPVPISANSFAFLTHFLPSFGHIIIESLCWLIGLLVHGIDFVCFRLGEHLLQTKVAHCDCGLPIARSYVCKRPDITWPTNPRVNSGYMATGRLSRPCKSQPSMSRLVVPVLTRSLLHYRSLIWKPPPHFGTAVGSHRSHTVLLTSNSRPANPWIRKWICSPILAGKSMKNHHSLVIANIPQAR